MKIAHVIPYFQPKVGYQEYYLAKAQQKHGHDVTIVTSERYFPFPNYCQAYAKLLGNRILRKGEFAEYGIKVIRKAVLFEYNQFLLLKDLKRTLIDLSPDLIISHCLEFPVAWQTARIKAKYLRNTKMIFDSHSGTYRKRNHRKRQFIGWAWQLFMRRLLLKVASKIVAVSDDGKSTLEKYFGLTSADIDVVPLGVDTDLFQRDIEERRKVRAGYGIGANDILGITTGKIGEFKGTRQLLDALPRLFDEYASLKFIFVVFPGDEKLMTRIRTLNPGRCFLSDSVPAEILAKYYSAADFAIWPRDATATHFEAMACGLPLIVSNLKLSAERIRWGNGYSVKNCTVDEIYRKVKLLLDNPEVMKTMEQKSRDAAEEYFSWDTLNRQFLRF